MSGGYSCVLTTVVGAHLLYNKEFVWSFPLVLGGSIYTFGISLVIRISLLFMMDSDS